MTSELSPPTPRTPRTPLTQRAWWPAARRIGTGLFFLLVMTLIVHEARRVSWGEVMGSVRDYPTRTLLGATALAFASHALYACFDLLSRRYAGHHLPTRRVLVTTFISYAFNLNFGALFGGLAFRVRLYTRQGLAPGVISRVYGFSALTNWLGYLALAGVLLLAQPLHWPDSWPLGSTALRVLGAALVAIAAAYVGLCFFSRTRSATVRGHALRLPSGRMALMQLAMSCANWALIGAVVTLLMQPHVDYPSVLTTQLAASVAGVVTHVPAGLGVFEAVYMSLLSPPLTQHHLLAALLVYRAVYYLAPLALAAVLYLGFELRLRREA